MYQFKQKNTFLKIYETICKNLCDPLHRKIIRHYLEKFEKAYQWRNMAHSSIRRHNGTRIQI